MPVSSAPAVGGGAVKPTTSEIVAKEVSASHVVTIAGYSLLKQSHARNDSITASFAAAGHLWTLRYYPNGSNHEGAGDYVAVFLSSATTPSARGRFAVTVLDGGGRPSQLRCATGNHCLDKEWGFSKFVKRKALEQSCYLVGDRLSIRCDITVLQVTQLKEDDDDPSTAAAPTTTFVAVPPPDMHRHLGGLLARGDGADVEFEVGGETFRAHRSILAARSPVLRAELFSPMREGAATCVWVADVDAGVFRALLHFVYTDSLPDDDVGGGSEAPLVMAQRLLVAADRYGLDRLKLLCEEKLCGHVDAGNVGTILAFAEQHGCRGLKKACFEFVMAGSNLKAAVVTKGFEHLAKSCPAVLMELLAKVAV